MKKIKLSLSICMMCLCVAVLCAGILAASSATYNINGNMSYNMIDGVALVNTRVYKVAGTTSESDLSTNCTTLSTMTFEEIERETSTYYILSQKLDSQPLINTSTDGTSATNQTSVDIVYGATDSAVEYYTYYIVVEIKNVSTDTGYVLNAYLNTLGTSNISNIASNANGESSSIEIESGKFSNIIIGLSYTGTTTTSETFSYTMNISYGEKPNPIKSLLTTYTDANSNSYWGVELGQVSSSDTTKLKWRYVGDYSTSSDGTETFTRYETYTTTKPTIGSGSVFVQETALTDNSVKWNSSYGINYFTDSTLRTSIKDGDLFSLTDKEKSYLTGGWIEARTLPVLYYAYGNCEMSGNFVYPYTSYGCETSDSKGTDYFWLMSVGELCTYFGLNPVISEKDYTVHAELVWKPSGSAVTYWLSNPAVRFSGGDDRYGTAMFQDAGYFSLGNYNVYGGVRAAFRLA